MSQRSESGEKVAATLLGVPAPRVDSSIDSLARKPVVVRAGTSVPDSDEQPLVPRLALPSRPAGVETAFADIAAPPSALTTDERTSAPMQSTGLLALVQRYPLVWMFGPMSVLAALAVAVVVATPKPGTTMAAAVGPATVTPVQEQPAAPIKAAAIAASRPAQTDLEAKPLGSGSAAELLKLAEARAERRRDAALALRKKLEGSPALGADKQVQNELLKWVSDPETSREALAAMVALNGPVGADLLYEVWAGTSARTDITELAHALVYSSEVRAKASPALAIALELRQAETCEQFRAALPKALKDGDRRSLTPLTKLVSKRGCGPKKIQDCYACLRSQADEVTATISAVKSRRPPAFTVP